MYGIVAAVTQKNITNFLINSIQKLEYRYYDSSDIAIIDKENNIIRIRSVDTVDKIKKANKKKYYLET